MRMKRGKDEEKVMFPRLHVNDTEKGGPRAPPRNKMALYQHITFTAHTSNHVMMIHCEPNNHDPSSSTEGGGYEGGMPFSRNVCPRYPSEKHGQCADLDEDDYSVPIFTQSAPTEFDNYSNKTNNDKTPLSNHPYMHPSSKFQHGNEREMFGNDLANRDCRGQQEHSGELRLSGDTAKGNSTYSQDLPSENQNNVHDLSNDVSSGEDGSFGPSQNRERDDSLSEISVLDTVSSPDIITPDDVVGIVGQKQFWEARKTIINQQRIFAVQLFELHRLIKVQKLISALPDLLLEDSAFLDRSIAMPPPSKKCQLSDSIKAIPKTSVKEVSSENAPSNVIPPPDFTPCFNNQWLVPVISPTEGLVYKPFPRSGGPPPTGSFTTPPMYGFPPPPHHSPFIPFGSHGYFPPYGMPMMAMPVFSGSGSSVEQTNPPTVPAEEKVQGSSASTGRQDMLALFPTCPAIDVGPDVEKASQVIKVVPHNNMSASESAARIFQSIQEEREQFDAE